MLRLAGEQSQEHTAAPCSGADDRDSMTSDMRHLPPVPGKTCRYRRVGPGMGCKLLGGFPAEMTSAQEEDRRLESSVPAEPASVGEGKGGERKVLRTGKEV